MTWWHVQRARRSLPVCNIVCSDAKGKPDGNYNAAIENSGCHRRHTLGMLQMLLWKHHAVHALQAVSGLARAVWWRSGCKAGVLLCALANAEPKTWAALT